MKRSMWVLLVVMSLILAACGGDDEGGGQSSGDQPQALGSIQWEKDANTIILRLDERRNQAEPFELANAIPPCTLWGDGRLVWLNILDDRREVLEARLSDEAVRKLLETVIFAGFYDWQSDYLMPGGDTNPSIQSISLNLYSEDRTVSRYSDWPVDGYQRILQACGSASAAPVLFLPNGGWFSVYEIPYDFNVGYWRWSAGSAGFALADVAASGPRWIEGDLAKAIWENTIVYPGQARALENEQAYMMALQVPGVSRDAPPPPPQ